MFAAFTYRDFRVQWFGACTSSIGTWMQLVAQNWLVLSLTHSPFFLGLDAFLQQLPIILFSLAGGVLADRRDRRRTLLASQYVQMATSATLAALMYFQVVQIWHILTLSFLTGVAQSFGGPAYQSLLPYEPQAMNACFALNSLSFLVVINTLMMLHVKHIPPATTGAMRDELKNGLSYVWHHGTLVGLTVLAAATTFLGFALLTFLPLFAAQVFKQGASTYSHLMAYSGAGSIVGALTVAWLGRFKRMGLTALLMQIVYGGLIIMFALSRSLPISELLLFFTGFALMMVFSTVTSLVQLIAPNEMRGRVMSIYMIAFRGGMPLGSLVSGWLATMISAPTVLIVNGVLLSLVAAWFLLNNHGVRDL
ncbi:MAG: MFS transporter [Acidobacteria bacterium]|nr:MAG: MFS transporter [Acidobacteriota bacterium]